MACWGKSWKTVAGLVALASLAGCGALPARVQATLAAGPKFKAKALGGPGHLFSAHHVVATMRPGAAPPIAGVRVEGRVGLAELHRLPEGTELEAALARYVASPEVQSVSKLELLPVEQAAPAAPAAPMPGVPQADPLRWQQWSHALAHVDEAWEQTKGRPDVVVAVLDTGVDDTHPDLQGQVLPGPDFGEGKASSRDIDDHGTHVAGIIGARAEDGVGLAGVAPGCRVMALKIFAPYFEQGKFKGVYSNSFAMAQAIQHATMRGAKVINVSASMGNDEVLETMMSMARAKGLVVCVSAGNQGRNVYSGSPKSLDGVVVVHATDANDRLASYSNFGNTLGLSAPGDKILSTIPTYPDPFTQQPRPASGYASLSGTSMASPFAAGVAALLASTLLDNAEAYFSDKLGREVKLKPSDIPGTMIEDLLRQSAVDLGRPGRDEVYGAGRVDAGRAVALAQQDEWVERLVLELVRQRQR